eukprot:TRINITY_DN39034_c0_g1_i1.p1 TRINITY_DN39034_c0_g1~~TRINITY_DN39034_c0_g1_i1.p1  ORF type:complete len:529 (-),score=119.83 TRINITY_DN39034_c0_g1_i1:71-1657(-)
MAEPKAILAVGAAAAALTLGYLLGKEAGRRAALEEKDEEDVSPTRTIADAKAGVSTKVPNVSSGEVAVLTLPEGTTHELKLLKQQIGSDRYLDIRDLYARSGVFTFDPGFTCTGSCMSAITYIDGNNGICLYRGYPVAELCEKAMALEVAYLLLVGELPDFESREQFRLEVKRHMLVHDKVKAMFKNFTLNAHPMAILVSVVGALACIFSELDPNNAEHRWLACTRLIAKMPSLAAMAYKTNIGEPIVYPKTELTFPENFLYMMFATPLEEYKVNPVHAKAINAFMILHMDHEQNASTSTVRIAASSQANPYACIAAGVASLWGPAHGGANEAVIKMLKEIGTKDRVAEYVAEAKKKGIRLQGFGHRVYKNYDPRARYMKKLCAEVLQELSIKDPLLEVAQELERIALADEHYIKRKLYPNVDFYSGIMLMAIGIPVEMFTVMFAMARTVGWVSQWHESVSEGQMRIGRPRQLYVGPEQRKYKAPPAKGSKDSGRLHLRRSFSQEQAELESQRTSSKMVSQLPPVTTR